MEWQVLLDLAATARPRRASARVTAGAVFAELAEAVPFYRGLTLDEIGGDGLRWPEREESATAARQALGDLGFDRAGRPARAPRAGATASCGSPPRPGLWASWVTEHSPSLRFLRAPTRCVELNPLDAERLGLHDRRRGRGERERRSRRRRPCACAAPSRAARPRCCSGHEGEQREPALRRNAPTLIEIGARRTANGELRTATCRMTPARRHHVRRDHGRLDHQVARDLRVRARGRADDPAARAQAAGPLPEPVRPQPRRPLRPSAAAGRRAEAALARSSSIPPPGVPGLMALAPAIMIVTALASIAIIPFGDVERGLRLEVRPVRDRRQHRHPVRVRVRLARLLRADARRLGVGLEVLVPRRDALRGAADQLRGVARPEPDRGRDDGRLAVAGRHREGAGRRLVRAAAVRRLPDLHGRRLRRDEPAAVRPARGRRRAGRRATTRSSAACASALSSWPST